MSKRGSKRKKQGIVWQGSAQHEGRCATTGAIAIQSIGYWQGNARR